MSVANKYNLLYFINCIASVCLGGFVAVFLQYKGVSNTLIGFITGSGCVISIFASPLISSLIGKIKGLDARKLIIVIWSILAIIYAFLTFVSLNEYLIMIIYLLMYALYISNGSLFQVVASDYMNAGYEINFGLARGLGSAAWAIGALIFGWLVDLFHPMILIVGFIVFTALMIIDLLSFPKIKTSHEDTAQKTKNGSLITFAKKYKIFMLILVGFAFMFASASATSTFMINIVNKLGGTTTFFGIISFVMAFSEMPVMAIVGKNMKHLNTPKLVLFGGFCYIIRNFGLCLAPNLPLLLVAGIFQGLSYGLLIPVLTYHVFYHFDEEDQVNGQMAILTMTSGVGATLGNYLGGFLQDAFGINAMYMFVFACTLIGFVIIFIANLLAKKEA